MISIIVPVYDTSEKYLSQCLESLINQTYRDIKIIVVNDGSHEPTEAICGKYANLDDRIEIINTTHRGTSSARNSGIESVQSEYIMFVDSDDWLEKDCCEKLINVISGSKYDLICFGYQKDYLSGKIKPVHLDERDQEFTGRDDLPALYQMKYIGSSCMKLYSSMLIGDERFDENLQNGEDVEFNFRVWKKIKSAYYIDACFYHYNIFPSSAVRNFRNNMPKEYHKTLKTLRREISGSEAEEAAYYSFAAISLLMLFVNHTFSGQNKCTYAEKRRMTQELLQEDTYKDMFNNFNKIKIPLSRKLPLLFARYRCYFAVYAVAALKNRIDSGK